MSTFVADASIAIGWIHPTQATDLTRDLLAKAKLGASIVVPSLWHLEVANALLVAVRRKLMTESHRRSGLAFLAQFRIVVDDETSSLAFSTISEIAHNFSLSTYDAAYLELARRRSLPLGTKDEPLRAAAKKGGVKIL